jgi:hypothetical protein
MTQEEIIKMAKEAGFVVTHIGDPIGTNYAMIEAFAKLVAEQEREKILGILRRKPDQQIYKVLDEIRSMN